jgi:hypothetical protein
MSPADRDVLTSLPRSRPTRRSAKRGGAPAADAQDPAGGRGPGPAPKPKAATAKAAPKAAAAPKPKAKAPAKTTAATKAAGKPAARAATPRRKAPAKSPAAKAAGAAPTPGATGGRRPVSARAGATKPSPPPAGWAAPKAQPEGRPGGGELIGTAVQAVGELAQIGLTLGGQALKQALSRIPRP